MTDNLADTFKEGVVAAKNGLDHLDNPYSDVVDENLFDAWADGFWEEYAKQARQSGECAA